MSESKEYKKKKNIGRKGFCDKCGIQAYFNLVGTAFGIRCSEHKDNDMINITKRKICEFINCKTKASYGNESDRIPKFCVKHKTETMKNTSGSVHCIHSDCKKRPCFNKEGETKGIYCKDHAPAEFVNVKDKKCQHPGCKTRPNFNKEGEIKGIYCKEHAPSEFINVRDKKCKHSGCKTRPNFNKEGEIKGIYCKEHAPPEFVNVIHEKCQHQGCKIIPTFNKEGETKGIYCKEHAPSEFVNVKDKRCQHSGCKIRPNFNKEGETKGIYCKKHAPVEFINVKSKKCKHSGCKIIPTFNKEGEIKGIYCKEHAPPEFVNVRDKKCKHSGCKKQPGFNKEGETKGIYCKEHAPAGFMDVKHKKCTTLDCKIRASYGIPGNKPTKCSQHKEINMLPYPTKRCTEKECKELALFGVTKQEHCEKHKQSYEINLVHKKCKICGLIDVVNQEGNCQDHDNSLMNRGYLQKQKRIKVLIENSTKYKIFSYDKVIDAKCNNKRPDFVFDATTHFIVLEVDEHQHKRYTYTQECEDIRMLEVLQSIGMSTIFIRYNPDDFKDKEGKKVKITQKERESQLLKYLDMCIQSKPNNETEMLRVLYLFYDEFEVTKQAQIEILKLPAIFKFESKKKEETKSTKEKIALTKEECDVLEILGYKMDK